MGILGAGRSAPEPGLTVTALAAAPLLAGPSMTAAVAFLGLGVAFDRREETPADLFAVDLTRDLDARFELMRFYVDALLIRPDGCVAWALPTGQDLDATTLVRALGTWFGQPA